jgi:primosomal protein N' (replication factor Y)
MENKIAQIIPLRKLPRGFDFFDYAVPEELRGVIAIGDLVRIPLKKTLITGLVSAFADETDSKKILPLDSLIEANILPPAGLKLLRWFAGYYCYSLASTLSLFLPLIPKRKSTKKKTAAPSIVAPKKAGADKIAELATKIADHPRHYLLEVNEPAYQKDLLMQLIEKFVGGEGQLLILLPRLDELEDLWARMTDAARGVAVVVNHDLHRRKVAYFEAWQKIKNKEVKIIIGTRSAVFAPFADLRLIVVNEADSADYKSYDQTPRYSAITVARALAKLTSAGLILAGAAFRVEDYYRASKAKWPLIHLGRKLDPQKIQVIDLVEERRREFTYLSQPLLDALKIELDAGRTSNLIVHKRGEAGFDSCRDCGQVSKCPVCGLPYSIEAGRLVCFHCHRSEAIPLTCPRCSSVNRLALGIGLDGVVRDLKKIFPGARIAAGFENSADIHLSSANVRSVDLTGIDGLVGVVYLDSLFYLADFATNEKIHSLLANLLASARQNQHEPVIIIQTGFKDNLAIKSLDAPSDYFYREELKARARFRYPPFCALTKVFFDHHDKSVSQREAVEIAQMLKKDFHGAQLEISEPYLYYRQAVRGRYRSQIMIKSSTKQAAALTELLRALPGYWSIDREPIDVL